MERDFAAPFIQLSGQIMGLMSLFLLLLFSVPAIFGWFSGMHVVVVGATGVLFGATGLILSKHANTQRIAVRFGMLLWSGVVCGITGWGFFHCDITDPGFFPFLWIGGTLCTGSLFVAGVSLYDLSRAVHS